MSASKKNRRLEGGSDKVEGGGDPRVDSPEVMQSIIRQVLFEEPTIGLPSRLPGDTPEALMAEPDGKVAFDLRVKSTRFSVYGVVGKVGRRQFKGMVWEFLREARETMGEIFSGTWRPVAARMDWGSRTRLQSRPSGVTGAAVFNYQNDNGVLKNNAQRNLLVPTAEQDIVLTVAFAEVTQRPIICPLFEARNTRGGARFGFADSDGMVSRMGTRDRDDRELAKELIRFTHMDEADPVSTLAHEDMERARVFFVEFGMTADEVAGALSIPKDAARALAAAFQSQAPKPAPVALDDPDDVADDE
jgi:hypothetical protein